MKPLVIDLNRFTTFHFLQAGIAGLVHFKLLHAFMIEINSTTIQDLTNTFALLLYKGHKKDSTLDSSYCTISTCPLIAKGLDLYDSLRASTKYQRQASTHELASLFMIKAVKNSKFASRKQVFLLFLDAKSALDTVVTPYLIRKLYVAGIVEKLLTYILNRRSSRIPKRNSWTNWWPVWTRRGGSLFIWSIQDQQ